MSEAVKPAPTFTHLAALLLWLVLQLLALMLPAFQIPVSDSFPRPVERVAAQAMVIVQVLSAAMLFPMLFRNVATTVAVVASTWPFLQLTGMLAGTPTLRLLSAGLYVAMWMVTLALVNSTLRSWRTRLRTAALATSFTLALPLFWYLRREFAMDLAANELLVAASPMLSIVEVLSREKQSAGASVFMSALLASSVGASMLLRRRTLKRDNLSTPHPQTLRTPSEAPPDF